MDVPKDQIATLMEHGLYDSAEMLGCFLVSSSTVSAEASPHLKAETLVKPPFYSAMLCFIREYRRAIHTYKQALHHCARIPKQSSGISRSSLSLSTRSSVNASSLSAINENEVRFKIASSHFALSETKAAIAEMESVKTRSLEMNILMAKLHRILDITVVLLGLAELGATAKDIISAFTQRYVEAQCCVASHAYKGALELFAELLQRFPNNVHLLTETAKVEAIIGKNDEAIMRFEKVVRSIDPYTLTCMDEYAMLLQMKCDYSRLNKLAHDLLSIDHTRAEVFVALSAHTRLHSEGTLFKIGIFYYCFVKTFCVYIHYLILCFRKLPFTSKTARSCSDCLQAAQNLRSDLRSYQGLVHSYLAFGKTKEALYTAREAMNAMPHSAKALKLVGDVHANTSSGRKRLEPGYLGAAIALADLHLMEGRNGDAVSLLERYLKDWADESLHVKLAQVFAATNMLQDALSHYQAALRMKQPKGTRSLGETDEGETSDGLKVQSHVSIGANDLLIVGAGVLGRLVAEKWREEHPDCQIIGQTVTINHHNELEKLGIKPALKETEFDGKFSYVIFCAPPSQSPDY
ncbi:hypothetical protein Bca52824_096931, partial [Brassica carinata]